MPKRVFRAVFIALLLSFPGQAALTAALWQADLQDLVDRLRATHPNLFFHVTESEFDAAVNDLARRMPQLSDNQITVEMMKLVAMVGDAHTWVGSPFPLLPIRFRWFSDGLFVNAAAPEYGRALGARVVEVGNLPVDRAYAAVGAVISHENDQWVREASQTHLAMAELLTALGVTSGPGPIRYLVEDLTGDRFEIHVSPSSVDMLWPPDSSDGFVPLWRRNYFVNYWFEYLPDVRALYLSYMRCIPMDQVTFADFFSQVLAFIQQNPVDAIVVDFRSNTGG